MESKRRSDLRKTSRKGNRPIYCLVLRDGEAAPYYRNEWKYYHDEIDDIQYVDGRFYWMFYGRKCAGPYRTKRQASVDRDRVLHLLRNAETFAAVEHNAFLVRNSISEVMELLNTYDRQRKGIILVVKPNRKIRTIATAIF